MSGHPARLLLALLCLLASYAYLNREQGRVAGMVMPAVASGPAMMHEAAQVAQPTASGMHDVGGMDMPMPGETPTPSAQPDLHGGGPNAPPVHDHSAHCPFCFAAAFALEAQGLAVPLPGAERLPQPALPTAMLSQAAPVHADARAPPA